MTENPYDAEDTGFLRGAWQEGYDAGWRTRDNENDREFKQACDLLAEFRGWNAMMESDQHELLKRVEGFTSTDGPSVDWRDDLRVALNLLDRIVLNNVGVLGVLGMTFDQFAKTRATLQGSRDGAERDD